MRIERHTMRLLRKRRRMLGLTQHQLARSANLPLWKISWSETGRVKLTAEETEQIRTAFAQRAAEIAAALSKEEVIPQVTAVQP